MQAKSSYFHKSLGGYSAVRPRRFDQLFDYVVDKKLPEMAKSVDQSTLSFTKSIPILDALNTKYVLFPTENGDVPITNPFAYGNAWFVSAVKPVHSADEEIKAIENADLKNTAIVNEKDFSGLSTTFGKDSSATIVQNLYKPNHIRYVSNNAVDGLAVFSEIYYPKGWNVYIDGKKDVLFRADYVLRAMKIPAGKHTVEFKFEPEVIKTGSKIALASAIGMVFLIAGGLYFERRKKWREPTQQA
jgi:hypothetical protein